MALKDWMKTANSGGVVVPLLDEYLLSLNEDSSNDRAIDVNAPSQTGTCMRARFYARTGEERDCDAVSSRTRRIFDNGTKTHERLQEYLKKQGSLLMDELPVINDRYNIQGHTDGLLQISGEMYILEIKSMNSHAFSQLKEPKFEHKQQALIYTYCIESRRDYLRYNFKTYTSFIRASKRRYEEYKKHYQHLKSGKHFTKEEKIEFQCNLHDLMDEILYKRRTPITKCVFLYENKDNQELKEFVIDSRDKESEDILKDVLKDYRLLNHYVKDLKTPPREGTSKSCDVCRWCDYKKTCFKSF